MFKTVFVEEESPIWREINAFPSTFSFIDRVFTSFNRKNTGLVRQKWTSTWLFPRRRITTTININVNKERRHFPYAKFFENAPKFSRKDKIKNNQTKDKNHVYMCFHIATIESTAGNKTRFFSSFFFIFNSWFFILAKAFRDDHATAFSTALHSATEKIEMGGYVTVPCSSKMTQRSNTAYWLKF